MKKTTADLRREPRKGGLYASDGGTAGANQGSDLSASMGFIGLTHSGAFAFKSEIMKPPKVCAMQAHCRQDALAPVRRVTPQ